MKFHFDADMKSVHKRLAEDEKEFRLGPEEWKKFNEILDRPAKVNENLHKLLTEPSVIEKGRV